MQKSGDWRPPLDPLLWYYTTDDQALWQQAMEVLLKNASSIGIYSIRWWFVEDLIPTWKLIKQNHMKRNIFVPDKLWETWKRINDESIPDDKRDEHRIRWQEFRRNFKVFCLAAGCQSVGGDNPIKYLEALRELVSRQFAYTADLHNRISKLERQIILQQRMITALAYRNVMENLAAKTTGANSSDKWFKFIDSVFKEFENQIQNRQSTVSSQSPFTAVVNHYGLVRGQTSLGQLKDMANGLFSTMSRTIHHFQPSQEFDQYTPIPGQFDPVEIDFLAAMKPTEFNEGEPDWDKERKRYIPQVVKPSQSQRQTQETIEDSEESEQDQKKKKNKKKKRN
jgi:hypothetical protein